ncbi:serine protease [Roseibium sp. SCPC15]|uniref:S1 family peptidase n=1 Tax=Roseibium sp. SCP15 TaxID=3141376 RepID=UPI003337F686
MILSNGANAAQRSAKLLVSDAGRLYRTAETLSESDKGEAYYRILVIVDVIRKVYPSSIEAAVLKTGRILNTSIELAAVQKIGSEWAEAHPDKAKTVEDSVVQEAGADLPTDGSAAVVVNRNRQKSTDAEPDKGVVAHIDDQTRTIKIPPVLRNGLKLPDFGSNTQRRRKDPPVADPVKKVSRSEVFSSLERAVVLILYVAEQDDKLYVMGSGTGFFVAPSRILTNAHVADIQSSVWERYKAKGFFVVVSEHIGMREAKIITVATRDTSFNIDAALLEPVNFTNSHHLSFAANAQIGEWIAIGGFPGKATDVDAAMSALVTFIERKQEPPLPETAIPTLRVDDGILSNKYVNKSSRALTLQYSLETTGGNSGSPIVNACGEVIGLHYSGSAEIAKVQKSDSGDYFVDVDTSKYNSAVASKELRYFFDRIEQPVSFSDAPCQVG